MDYKEKWVIKAVFVDYDTQIPKGASYYDEQLFDTKEQALEWIDSEESDWVVECCNIDAETEKDLKGTMFDDLEPIQVKDLPYDYQMPHMPLVKHKWK